MVVFGGCDNWGRLVRDHKLRSGTYFTDYPVWMLTVVVGQ